MIITFCGHSTYSPTREDEETMLRLFDNAAKGQAITFYLGGYGSLMSKIKGQPLNDCPRLVLESEA